MTSPALAALRAELSDLTIYDDAPSLRMHSRDFFWFSPVLKPDLENKQAELIILPRDKAEVRRIASACARHRVPLTVRGGGTGNYGQAVPLEGGVVLNMTRVNRVVSTVLGAGRFESGANMLDIDKALAPLGQELRMHPSTRAQATLGGFVAGGAAGAGSCTWGQIDNLGAVIAVEVMTVEPEPRLIELRGREILKVMHAYGVNGIITEVEVPLAPAHAWAERNLAATGVDLQLGDMADAFPELDSGVDVVVCNPPYIPLEAWASVATEARDHDPALALWSGDDGLDAIRVLEATAARLLRPGGWVGTEHADVQGESAAQVFVESGRWTEVRDHPDLAGRARYLTARLAR